ncbi:MAG: zinc-binding alcohol dehydrogenase [Hyphomicrobiales bacterium]
MAEQVNQEKEKLAQTRALFYEKAGLATLKSVDLPILAANEILVESLYSGISRGTESLVFNGKIPESEWKAMRCPHQTGDFSFPVSYGYASVGKVIALGSAITKMFAGETVFVLHPHQEHLIVSENMARPIPEHIPANRAVLSANMETALNAVWDANLEAHHTVSVVGGGVVGLLTAYVASQISDNPVTLIDINPNKKTIAEKLGLKFALPNNAVDEQDIVFHTSANGAGLQTAINLLKFEGSVIEMSWYGDKPVQLSLGGPFHSKRLKIISSQVGHVSPAKRATHGYDERMAEAMQLLADPVLDHLLEEAIAFNALADALPEIFSSDSETLCQLIKYGD